MLKLQKKLGFALVITLFSSSSALANICGDTNIELGLRCCDDVFLGTPEDEFCVLPATTYDFTVNRVGLQSTAGNTVELGSSKNFNAGTVAAGQVVGDYVDNSSLPDGSYNSVIPQVSSQLTVSNPGNTDTIDGTQCLPANGIAGMVPPSVPDCSIDPSQTCISGNTIIFKFPQAAPIVVTPNSPHSLSLLVETRSGVLYHAKCEDPDCINHRNFASCVPVGPAFPIMNVAVN